MSRYRSNHNDIQESENATHKPPPRLARTRSVATRKAIATPPPWNDPTGRARALSRESVGAFNVSEARFTLADKVLLARLYPDEVAAGFQTEIAKMETSCNKAKYERVSIAYDYAAWLCQGSGRWADFNNRSFWGSFNKQLSRHDALRLSMMFFYGALRGPMANDAARHARALSGAWRERVPVKELFSQLCSKKFSGMSKEAQCIDRRADKSTETYGKRQNVHISEVANSDFCEYKDGETMICAISVHRVGKKNLYALEKVLPKEGARGRQIKGVDPDEWAI